MICTDGRDKRKRGTTMKKVVKKSPLPSIGAAAVWILQALSGKLSSFGQFLSCAALALVVYLVLKAIFPHKLVEVPDKPVEQLKPKQQAPVKKAESAPKQAEPVVQEPSDAKSTGNQELDAVLQQGREAVAEIRRLNDAIPDFKISAELKQLEILTERIFAFVEKNPAKLREIRQFLDYYLPTTIKLLRQYVTLQDQGMRLGNIDEGMKRIEQMLEKIIVAFQQQLDSLFESDVVDITADIQVMEQMMAGEGLTGQKDF